MSQRYDTYLQVRLTAHDKERIKARALEAGLKTSEYIRKLALEDLRCPSPGELEDDYVKRRLSEFRVAGNGYGKLVAQSDWLLYGETMHKGSPALRKLEAEQLERNIRGSVGMQAPRNEP